MARTAREGFPHHYRIVRPSEYKSAYALGRKLMSERFVLFGLPNNRTHHRLGITASRKIGGAVVRNRVKRLFREIFRRICAGIPDHFDFVVNAKRSCGDCSYVALRAEFQAAVTRLLESDKGGRHPFHSTDEQR